MPVDPNPRNVLRSGMRYEHLMHLMDRTDKAELAKALQIIAKGKALRNRVLSRLRMRAKRAKDKT